jgi:NADPH-dependent curcumin reductase CurA
LGSGRESHDCPRREETAAEIKQTKLRLNIRGFIFFDYIGEFGHAQSELKRWIDESKLKILKTEYKCKFEDVPHGLDMLLKGENIGSLVTEVMY